jgi:GDP-L-fucose synthase
MILITGANGFIGRNLKEYLETKFDVLVPSSSQLNLLHYEDTKSFFRLNKIQAIIHCASRGVRITPNLSDDITLQNVAMFQNIVRSASDSVLIINMGSGAEYDKSRALERVKESQFGEQVPQDSYGYSKYLISKEIEKHTNTINLRLFGVYGPYEHYDRFPSYAVRQLISRKVIDINQDVVFSYLFVGDLCRIVECFLKYPPESKFLNVVPSEVIRLTEICETLFDITGVDVPVILKNKTLNKEYSGNNEELLAELGRGFEFSSHRQALHSLIEYHSKRSISMEIQ